MIWYMCMGIRDPTPKTKPNRTAGIPAAYSSADVYLLNRNRKVCSDVRAGHTLTYSFSFFSGCLLPFRPPTQTKQNIAYGTVERRRL